MNPEPYEILAQICVAKNITRFVVSPGSRCAPVLLALARHPEIDTKTVSDERSAAFLALGMADTLAETVGLLCTSGSAAINYGPAISEAFYRNIPLLILTADRPPEWIGQQDGQAIPQANLYGPLVKAHFELPVNYNHPDEKWHFNRILNEAINLTQSEPKGPVHINVPIREPFYPSPDQVFSFNHPIRLITETPFQQKPNKHQQLELVNQWLATERKMIIAGQCTWNENLRNAVQALRYYSAIPVVADITANLHNVPELIRHHDLFLPELTEEEANLMTPDLLVTFGLSVLSKSIKQFIRRNKPKEHWHIQLAGPVADPFQSLTRIIRLEPSEFITTLGENEFFAQSETISPFTEAWQRNNTKAAHYIQSVFRPLNPKDLTEDEIDATMEKEITEFAALASILKALPEDSALHLANSMPVRYANYIHLNPEWRIKVFANRGTSGIDGCTSTAIGSAWAFNGLVFLFTGDMAFLYDRNGLWHNYLPPNIRIVVFNNHGGGIFRMIDGPSRQPELAEYFETRQALNIQNTARDFGIRYWKVNKENELESTLSYFLEPDSGAAILEIETAGIENAGFMKAFKAGFSGGKQGGF